MTPLGTPGPHSQSRLRTGVSHQPLDTAGCWQPAPLPQGVSSRATLRELLFLLRQPGLWLEGPVVTDHRIPTWGAPGALAWATHRPALPSPALGQQSQAPTSLSTAAPRPLGPRVKSLCSEWMAGRCAEWPPSTWSLWAAAAASPPPLHWSPSCRPLLISGRGCTRGKFHREGSPAAPGPAG